VIQHSSQIRGGFWGRWQSINAQTAIFHQWDQLERSGCIDNFRILAENKPVFRQGWYFADSDAYKWLEAACLILQDFPDPGLEQLVMDFISLIGRTQDDDGYLYTFNQIHFPGTRWVNLQIEHELYCHGHLIEAGVSRAEANGEEDLLKIACKAADRIVADFLDKGPRFTPGHEEVEIALLRLFQWTGEGTYLQLARQFLEKRGKSFGFGIDLIWQFIDNNRRLKSVAEMKAAFEREHVQPQEKRLPPSNRAKKPPHIQSRWIVNTLWGKFFQQHKPLHRQTVPVGHAVRFAYLQTAAAMLDQVRHTKQYLPTLEKSWDHVVSRRMFLTGGIGSLPLIEGFGRDYELDPAFAYAETCAALGSLFWNREMGMLTGEAKYSDLFEWQLYNAALVGMGVDGNTYFYNNPLQSDGGIERRAWYEVPCCPSNLSRTFARLADEVLFVEEDAIRVEQYFSSRHRVNVLQKEVELEIESQLPWQSKVEIKIKRSSGGGFRMMLRQPSWSNDFNLAINCEIVQADSNPLLSTLDPNRAKWIEITREWQDGDRVLVDFVLQPYLLFADERTESLLGKAALACGPLVFCLESIDNPDVNMMDTVLDPDSMRIEWDPDLFGGCNLIRANSIDDTILNFIPYHLWGNRGKSEMTVFVNVKK